MPAFAGMTNQLGSKYDETYYQPAPKKLSVDIRVAAFVALCTVVGVFAVLSGCGSDREARDVWDEEVLVRYISETRVGQELFRTEGLIPDDPYTKPSDPAATYRDYVDSVNRQFYISAPVGEVEKEFELYGVVDDAEVLVDDRFYVRTGRVEGTDVSFTYSQRLLTRIGYFLRLGSASQGHAGWLLHAFNGGSPRGMVSLKITRENGSVFRGDESTYEQFRYIKYTTVVYRDPVSGRVDSIRTDTSASRSRYSYIQLQDIAQVTRGNSLVFRSGPVDAESAYQLISAETERGFTQQRMHRLDDTEYVDTIWTPAVNSRTYNIVFLREFRQYDYPGGTWCVPYKTR